ASVEECKMQNAKCKMTANAEHFCILHFAFCIPWGEGTTAGGLLLKAREHCAHEFASWSAMFRQLLLDSQHVLRAVYSQVRLARLQQTDFKTVLQGSQLLERLGALERRERKRGKRTKHRGLVSVQPDVPLRAGLWRAREVE